MLDLMFAIAVTEAAAVPQEATRFDLICEGVRSNFGGGVPTEVVSYRLRVDLEGRLWCGADCSAVGSIQEVTAVRITLTDRESPLNRTEDRSWIDRIAGKHWSWSTRQSGGYTVGYSQESDCTPAPFTEIPARRF